MFRTYAGAPLTRHGRATKTPNLAKLPTLARDFGSAEVREVTPQGGERLFAIITSKGRVLTVNDLQEH